MVSTAAILRRFIGQTTADFQPSSSAPTSLLSGASQRMINHARTDRDSYISNATPAGKSSHATFKQWFRRLKPRHFRNLSVFSIELAATSLTH
jgi:hypothetical protein